MPRPSLTPEQKREIRRNIRQAAAKIYAEQGVKSITARAVANEAGVSVGTIYSYFDGLSGLLQSLWREPMRRLVRQMVEAADAIESPRERLKKLLTMYVEFSRVQESVFRSAFLFVRPESVPAPEQIALKEDRFFQLFANTIRDGQKQGQFRSGNANKLTQTVLSAVHGSLALPINLHRLALDDSPQVARNMIDVMLEWLEAA